MHSNRLTRMLSQFCVAAGAAVLIGAASAQPRHGGTLNWIVNPIPTSLVPINTSAGGNTDIGPKIVEGLLTYDMDLRPRPLLATAWSVSADGLQYRFELRRGVKWHDGKDFTSADVAFSITTLKQFHPRGRGTFASVTEVRTPDLAHCHHRAGQARARDAYRTRLGGIAHRTEASLRRH